MKNRYLHHKLLTHSTLGFLIIAGALNAHAQTNEEDLYLRSQVSPYVTSTELAQVTPVTTIPSITPSPAGEVEPEPQFNQFLSTLFSSSSLREATNESEESFFARLLLAFGIAKDDITTSQEKDSTVLTDITVAGDTATSATFTWDVQAFADITLYYAPSTDGMDITPTPSTPHKKISAFTFTDKATLEGLEPATRYSYLIVVNDHFSPMTVTSRGSFKTLSE